MRAAHALILVLVVVLFGAVSFFIFSGTQSPPVAQPVSSSEDVAGTSSTAEPALAEPEVERPQQVEASATERVAQREQEASPKRSGGGAPQIRGRVVDASGQPLAEAWVRVGPSGFMGVLALEQDHDHAPTPFASKERRDAVQTGADGTFVVRGPLPGSFNLSVRKPGFVPHRRSEIPLPADDEFELETVVLEPSVVLAGRVIDSAGRAVGGAKLFDSEQGSDGVLTLRAFGSGVALAETAADGSFRIDEIASGPWALRVTSEAHPDELATGETRRAGEWVENLVIQLEDGYEIHGRVANSGDFGSAELRVVAAPVPEGQETTSGSGFVLFGHAADGEARFADVESGDFVVRGLRADRTYRLQAMEEGRFSFFGANQSKAVVAKSGERGVVLNFEPTSSLAFQVVDAETNAPITEFEASAGVQFPMPLMDEEGSAIREHPEGRVRFDGLRAPQGGEHAVLEIIAQGYQRHHRKDVVLRPGGEVDLGVIALSPVPMVRVSVVDDLTGAPVEGARVTLATAKESDGQRMRVSRRVSIGSGGSSDEVDFDTDDSETGRTDEEGIAQINSFEGKDCTVTVRHDDYATRKSEVFSAPVGLSHDLEVRLRGGGAVEVTLLDADAAPLAGRRVDHKVGPAEDTGGMHFDASHFSMGGSDHVTDSDGIVVFEHLAPGVHRFRPGTAGGNAVWGGNGGAFVLTSPGGGSGEAWTEVEVFEGDTAQVTLTAVRRVKLSGVVREDGVPLMGARLQLTDEDGDDDPVARLMHGGPSTKTSGQGEYEFDDLKPGRYTLSVNHESREMAEEFSIEVLPEGSVLDVDLTVAIIEGRVFDQEGEPLGGIRVWADRAKETNERRPQVMMISATINSGGGGGVMMHDGSTTADTSTYTDEEGRYELRGVMTDKEIQVVAEGDDVQPTRSDALMVAPGQLRTGVDLEMEAAGAIEVLCQRPDGSPSDATVLCTASFEGDADEQPDDQRQLIQGGRVVLDGLAPGPWKVSLRSIGMGGSDDEPIPDQVVDVLVRETVPAAFTLP